MSKSKSNSPRLAKSKTIPSKAKNAASDPEPAATVTAALPGAERGNRAEEIVGTIFQNDSAVREAMAGSLKGRSIERKALTTRANKAFANFQPTKYPSDSTDTRPRSNYVKPGENVAPAQHEVIKRGIEAIQKSATPRSLNLVDSAGLKALMTMAPANDESIAGTIPYAVLMPYIEERTADGTFFAKDVYTICKAEIEAERRLKEIMAAKAPAPATPANGAGPNIPAAGDNNNGDESDPDASLAAARMMVRENVNLQMRTATSPEARLSYDPPEHSKQAKGVHYVPTFELRQGASDVTSYHDFHNLQIAFENVWTEMFDAKVGNLGKQLFEEYVKLKAATGVDNTPDRPINTIDDLRHLMDEIRDFSRIAVDSIPGGLKQDPEANSGSKGGLDRLFDDGRDWIDGAIRDAGKFVEDAKNTLTGQNQEGLLTQESFNADPPLPLGDVIRLGIEHTDAKNTVMIRLEAGPEIHGNIGLDIRDEKGFSKGILGPLGYTQSATLSLQLDPSVEKLVFHFIRTISIGVMNGVYKLHGLKNINPGDKVHFTWTKSAYTG